MNPSVMPGGDWPRRRGLAVLVALIVLGTLRIVGSYSVLGATFDEPAHLACGLEWFSRGTYRYEPMHPPLARVAVAIGPYLDGLRSQGQPEMWREGAALAQSGNYGRTLLLSRLGILPFFWLACVVVYLWGRRCLDEAGACLAVLIFSLLPPVLAHAALATTDMALTATLGAAFLAALAWCERPGVANGLTMGAAAGLAILSKFSALAFLPAAGLAALLCHVLVERPEPASLRRSIVARLPGLALAASAALCVIWAGYRFSFGPVPFLGLSLPFPELFAGLRQAAGHEHIGAGSAYLLSHHSDTGWWWYYLVVLGVKTPLTLFVPLGGACLLGLRRDAPRGLWMALAFSLGILGFCLGNRINLGVRHILPVYLGFSVLAAAGLAALLRRGASRPAARWLAVASMLGLTASSLLAHPDYIPYFNLLAGPHPERVLVDSDLDWGQDIKRLSSRLRQLHVSALAFSPCMPLYPDSLGLPALTPYDFVNPAPGWNAVRQSTLQLMLADVRAKHPGLRFWAETVPPRERIGAGILLWYFPPEAVGAPAPGGPSVTVHC